MKRRPHAYRTRGVFLNVPFDDPYENCFVALIAGVAGLGLKPTSVLDVSTSDQPRFNMPFEAGLASALALTTDRHERFLFEARRYRLARTCSDLDGVDVKSHAARPRGVLRAVLNAFVRPRRTPRIGELELLYNVVRIRARELKQEARTLYEAHPFRELAAFAMWAADKQYGRHRRK